MADDSGSNVVVTDQDSVGGPGAKRVPVTGDLAGTGLNPVTADSAGYLIYTSADIRALYAFKRLAWWPYSVAMRQVNVIFTRALRPSPAPLARHDQLKAHAEQADRPVELE